MAEIIKMEIERILTIMLAVLLGSLITLLTIQIAPDIYKTKSSLSLNANISDYNGCMSPNLEISVGCIKNWINTFYKFIPRDEMNYTGNQGSLEDIKQNGGDCYDYSKLYISILNQSGFNAKMESLFSDDNKRGHGFVIAWNKNLTEYCTIEATYPQSIRCFEFLDTGELT